MKNIIAYCGINCNECPAYIATQNNDDVARAKVAEEWQKIFNPNIKPEDINCDGCTSADTRLFSHCLECQIRLCGIEKKVENCAYCPEYACDKLKDCFKIVPAAQTTLDSIRNNK
ncbi:MAG: DUF3795 domain-containing protein [Candidatus Latescibacteria bacterium]|nr:DUF3795 domain-containing protein [Candidatus Latescibacterota bacterium]